MTVSPRVSVALCTYNGVRFIAAQVRSILAQSEPPAEIVVSDDGSTDGTLSVLRAEYEKFVSEHPEVQTTLRVIENSKPLGVTRNFEQSIRATSGDLIALSDQDDVWHADRLKTAVAEFEARPDLLLLQSDARLVDADGRDLGHSLFEALGVTRWERDRLHSGQAVDALLKRNLTTGATVMIRRGLAEQAFPFPREWVHDEWLAIIGSLVGRIDGLDVPLIDYRQHGSNQIGVRKLSLTDKFRRLTGPRAQTNAELLARAVVLAERGRALSGVSEETRQLLDAKTVHQRRRAELPPLRLFRLPTIIGELIRGGYGHYARGLADAVRDLIQPVHHGDGSRTD